jgi:hypothetical protein
VLEELRYCIKRRNLRRPKLFKKECKGEEIESRKNGRKGGIKRELRKCREDERKKTILLLLCRDTRVGDKNDMKEFSASSLSSLWSVQFLKASVVSLCFF